MEEDAPFCPSGAEVGIHIQLLDQMRKLFFGRLGVDAGGIKRGMSQQPCETDQIPWVVGEVAWSLGMEEPVGAHLSWEARAHEMRNEMVRRISGRK